MHGGIYDIPHSSTLVKSFMLKSKLELRGWKLEVGRIASSQTVLPMSNF